MASVTGGRPRYRASYLGGLARPRPSPPRSWQQDSDPLRLSYSGDGARTCAGNNAGGPGVHIWRELAAPAGAWPKHQDTTSLSLTGRFMDDALAFMNGLYGTAVRLTRDGDAARDLVQDTYLKALRAQGRFQPGTNLKAWLYAILHNTWRNRRRDGARARVSLRQRHGRRGRRRRPPGRRGAATPESQLLATVLDADLQAALDRLPEAFREAVWLRDVEDLSYQEIAEALSIPIGTVMSRIARGRRLLHTFLREAPEAAAPRAARRGRQAMTLVPREPGGDCRQIEALLPPFVDGAASAMQRDRVAAHLARCPACRHSADAQASIRQLLRARRGALCGDAPPGLDAQLRRAAAPADLLGRRGRLSALAAAAALVLAVTGAFAWTHRSFLGAAGGAAHARPHQVLPHRRRGPRRTPHGARRRGANARRVRLVGANPGARGPSRRASGRGAAVPLRRGRGRARPLPHRRRAGVALRDAVRGWPRRPICRRSAVTPRC